MTTSDKKQARRIQAWEESRLSSEKLLVAVRLFSCHILDEAALSEDDPFGKIISKHRAPSFIVLHQEEFLGGSGMRPTSSKLYSVLKSSISHIYSRSLDRIVQEGLSLKKKLDRIEDAKKRLDQRLSRMDPRDSRAAKYLEERKALGIDEKSLREAAEKLYDLEGNDGT